MTEYTLCMSKGGCLIRSGRSLDAGTRFIFELFAEGESQPVEVEGLVVSSTPVPAVPGAFDIGVKYLAGVEGHPALDRLLARLISRSNHRDLRRAPRVPVHLLARGVGDQGLRFLVRDVSMGGVGLMLPVQRPLPPELVPGASATMTVTLTPESSVRLPGRIVWTAPLTSTSRARLGVQFNGLESVERLVLSGLTRLARPHALSLQFGEGDAAAVPPVAKPSTRGMPPEAVSVARLVREIAAMQLRELTGLVVSADAPVPAPALVEEKPSETVSARVGLAGALEGDLVLLASPELARTVAASLAGQGVDTESYADVRDALAELLTRLGGMLCDRLEALGHDAEVTPPMDIGSLALMPSDSALLLRLEVGSSGCAVLLRLRETPAGVWPQLPG